MTQPGLALGSLSRLAWAEPWYLWGGLCEVPPPGIFLSLQALPALSHNILFPQGYLFICSPTLCLIHVPTHFLLLLLQVAETQHWCLLSMDGMAHLGGLGKGKGVSQSD